MCGSRTETAIELALEVVESDGRVLIANEPWDRQTLRDQIDFSGPPPPPPSPPRPASQPDPLEELTG